MSVSMVSTRSPPSSMVLSFYASSSLSPPPTPPAKRARKMMIGTAAPVPMFFPANLSVTRGPAVSSKIYPPSLLNSRPLPCIQLKRRPRSMTTNVDIPTATTPRRIKLEDIPPLPFAFSSTTITPSLTSSNSSSSNHPNKIISKMPTHPSCQVKSNSFNESSSSPMDTSEEKKTLSVSVPSRTNSLPIEDTSSKRFEKLPSFQKSGMHFKSKRRTSLTFVPRAA